MENKLELDVLLKNMRYDQLITNALRNNEPNRAIAISKRRHEDVKRLIKGNEKNK